MTRVAAIDCGTNTIKLLIADLDPASGIETELVREMRMVRLGQDVDRAGRLGDDALERVFGAVDEFAAVIDDHDPQALRFCATSAARDASNADVFTTGVRERLGVTPEVLTGDEEARLSYDGATRGLDRQLPPPHLVVDIGGGSTELVVGEPGQHPAEHGRVRAGESLDVGSVRLTERHLASDPPTKGEIAAAVEDIDRAIDAATNEGGVPLDEARTVIGVAGTITTTVAGILDLPRYDRKAIHHALVARKDVHTMTESLLGMMRSERTALPYMHPGRADVIGAGALILDRVLRRTTVDAMLASESDILDGIAWSLA